jgi:hypothetical protein
MVTRHEQRHVEIDRQLLTAVQARMQAAVSAVAAEPVGGRTVAETRRTLQARIAAAMNRTVAAFSAERTERQLAIDTPAEYDKLPKACGQAALQALLRG